MAGRRIFYATISQIHELVAATGAVLRSFPAPAGPSRALTFGRNLLFSGGTTRITAFHPTSLMVHGLIDAPGGGSNRAEGLALDTRRRILFVANQSENTIYALQVGGI